MTEIARPAARLKEMLKMDVEPVGVRFYSAQEQIPDEIRAYEPEQAVKSYCQALNMAARGKIIFGGREKLGCVLGTSILGLEKDPAPLLNDTVQEKYGAGLFETEEASRASVDGAPRLEPGQNQAVLVGPADSLPATPSVIILEIDPEQAMWLLYAANYRLGGRQSLPQSGGVAGGCSDVTLAPLLNSEVNITFYGLGCRIKSAIPKDRLIFGLPVSRLNDIVKNLEKMAKPMQMLAQVRENK